MIDPKSRSDGRSLELHLRLDTDAAEWLWQQSPICQALQKTGQRIRSDERRAAIRDVISGLIEQAQRGPQPDNRWQTTSRR